eukprot:Protomagalhaensia_sp_Gyna_25__4555@NODE_419_length_3499_cov_6_374277_g322_i0_p1_GENE_NODE_419_length_3499_cov_6_374277_g322_i0NODE_419_length_3499_cov_6_374277_g322_i0_p1_ORF_typecomplete_len452_score89_00Acyltransferase/PF01553_21/0_00011_NODE_419_length_3499_cov_6_374277_g322_i07252080
MLKLFFRKALQYHRWVQFFIEGGRSRTGFVGRPKKGLLAEGLRATVVPVRINYGICPEYATIGYELFGKEKEPETFQRFFSSAIGGIQKQDLVQLRVGNATYPPVSEQVHNVTDLAWQVVYSLQDAHSISFASLLATTLCTYGGSLEWELDHLTSSFEKSWTYVGAHNILDIKQVDAFEEMLLGLFQRKNQRPFTSLWQLHLKEEVANVPTASTIAVDEDASSSGGGRRLNDASKTVYRALKPVQFSHPVERNESAHQLNYIRFAAWDLLGFDSVTAVVLMDEFTMEKSSQCVAGRIKVLGDYINGLVWGERISEMSLAAIESRAEKVKEKCESVDPYLLLWLRSLFIPLANALKLLFTEVIRLVEGGVTNIASKEFLKQCRSVASNEIWGPGMFPVMDVDLIRSVLRLGGYRNARVQIPRFVPVKQLRMDYLRNHFNDFCRRIECQALPI